MDTVNQQILAAIKFGVSQNKVIWQLLNLASPCGPSMQRTIDIYVGGDKYQQQPTYMLAATNISENTQFAKFAKYNSTPKFVDLQYLFFPVGKKERKLWWEDIKLKKLIRKLIFYTDQ